MGAYLQITLPTHGGVSRSLINAEYEPDAGKLLPEQLREDYVVTSSEREQRTIGSRQYEKQEVAFQLRDELFAEIPAFLRAFYDTLLQTDLPDRYSYIRQYLPKFLADDFPKLDFSPDSLSKMDDQLARMKNNYFLRWMRGVGEMVVYCGWPFEAYKDRTVFLGVFTILNAQYKLGEFPEDEEYFTGLAQRLQAALQDRFRLARYLYMMGF